ncbi:hypothetical protein [Vagococcus fluvialis]|uniref:hypothetical protein n=1 Tax=Vagococcus fluvialis TaxID=2738 RepID=UPI001D0B2EB9|nr:hypothetical protein [Vagococcus fluvialis]UDM72768.1 hypothetical protein K5L00_14535 [Vagococcus fluvialis]UDM78324.1 hypothetical protein K5K98_14740 [Vagococcus fluvialis]UDM84043.1 hypothetical protein K5K96_14560 [Vagococcus fluvialis]
MELYEIIRDELTENTVNDETKKIVVEYLRNLMWEDNVQETVLSMVSEHLENKKVESKEILEVSKVIASECLRLNETPLTNTSLLSEKKLVESEMTFDEKYQYLVNFPIQNKFFKDGQELHETSVHCLQDALGGVGYTLISASEVMEFTLQKLPEKECFYLVDDCDDETSMDSYTYLGKEIFEVLDKIVDTEKLILDHTENDEWEWALIDGKLVRYDELHREINQSQYIHDFHQHPVWVVQEVYDGIPEAPSIYMNVKDIYESSEIKNNDLSVGDVNELLQSDVKYYSDGADTEIRVFETVQNY